MSERKEPVMNVVLALALLTPSQPPIQPQPNTANPQAPSNLPLRGNDRLPQHDHGFGLTADAEIHWPLFIAASPDVQKELKLTKEQIASFEKAQIELTKSVREFSPAITQRSAQVGKLSQWADAQPTLILTPAQQKRHRQLVWQLIEANTSIHTMLANTVFAKEIGLTADQQTKAKKIQANFNAARHKLMLQKQKLGANSGTSEDALVKKYDESALKLLTDEQKKKWNEALGECFKGEVTQPDSPGPRPVAFKAIAKK